LLRFFWITVYERQINGSSKWRLLDHAGRKVSERKKDLDDLLDHLNIDATNPLAVMTQVGTEILWGCCC
jgi:hypothetical protein